MLTEELETASGGRSRPPAEAIPFDFPAVALETIQCSLETEAAEVKMLWKGSGFTLEYHAAFAPRSEIKTRCCLLLSTRLL